MTQGLDIEAVKDRVIAAVRAGLAENGRPEVEIEREWLTITEGESNSLEMLLLVPIGRDLTLPLSPLSRDGASHEDSLDRFATHLAGALPNVDRARWHLRRYAADVRREAVAQLAALRGRGEPVALAGVSLKETRAWHLTGGDWKYGLSCILATVLIEGLDHHLLPQVLELVVEEPEHVLTEIEDILDEQRARHQALTRLRERGASVAVDLVALRLLDRHGLDAVAVLRRVVEVGYANIPVLRDGTVGNLYLINSGGLVMAAYSVRVEDVFNWSLDHVQMRHDPDRDGPVGGLVGRSLATVTGDPIYDGMTVAAARAAGDDWIELRAEVPARLFDAVGGRFVEGRLAA